MGDNSNGQPFDDSTTQCAGSSATSARPALSSQPVLLSAVIASAMDAVVALDATQRIVLFNPAAETMFGCSADDALGEPLDRFLPERFRGAHHQYVSAFGRTGDTSRAMGHLRPLAALRADGTEFPIEATISRVAIDGHPFVAAIVRDITGRVAAENERAVVLAREAAARLDAAQATAQRDELQAIIDGMPSGIEIVRAPDGRIEQTNDAFSTLVFGEDAPTETIPQYGTDFVFLWSDGTPLPFHERPGSRALRGERVRNQQLVLQRADGSRIPIAIHAAPLRMNVNDSDKIDRAILVAQDVTQLHQAEQLKDDFLSLISHELRTPLTAIHGGARLLAAQGDVLDAATRAELLADVVIESERLEQLLVNLTTLAALLAGRLAPVTEPVLLGPLVRTVAQSVAEHSPRHTFVAEVPPGTPAVEADPSMLEEVLRNLYENAVKYAPEGGEIRTLLRSDARLVTIDVVDQGIGIAQEHLGQVFDRFRRPGAPATTRGMGLGLYLVRLLIEAQGGTIGAASPGPGHGSIFTVSLPVAQGWDTAEPDDMQTDE